VSSRKTALVPSPLGLQLSYWPVKTERSLAASRARPLELFRFRLASGRREGESLESVPACVEAAAIFQRDICAVNGAVAIGGVSTVCFGHDRVL